MSFCLFCSRKDGLYWGTCMHYRPLHPCLRNQALKLIFSSIQICLKVTSNIFVCSSLASLAFATRQPCRKWFAASAAHFFDWYFPYQLLWDHNPLLARAHTIWCELDDLGWAHTITFIYPIGWILWSIFNISKCFGHIFGRQNSCRSELVCCDADSTQSNYRNENQFFFSAFWNNGGGCPTYTNFSSEGCQYLSRKLVRHPQTSNYWQPPHALHFWNSEFLGIPEFQIVSRGRTSDID